MFLFLDKAILGMAILRLISGSIEIFVALLILKMNDIEKALVMNSSLALIGPPVLLLTTVIGLTGMADKVSLSKIYGCFAGLAAFCMG